jgi:hypothetical protein
MEARKPSNPVPATETASSNATTNIRRDAIRSS